MPRRSPGEGSIIQLSNGRWQARLQVDGRRRAVYGKTRTEAARKLHQLKQQATDTGALPDPGTRTVDQLLDRWLETAAPTLKPRTLESYRQTTRLYLRPDLGHVRLAKLTPDRIQRAYAELQRRGLSRAPAKAHAVLHRALRLAVLWGWLAQNPADRVLKPRYAPTRREVWTEGELATFIEGAKGHWLYPAWLVLIGGGLRSGELRALTWGDVDWAAGCVEVRRALHRIEGEWVLTRPKTLAGERVVTLPPLAMEVLAKQRAQQAAWQAEVGSEWANARDLVFTQADGSPMHAATVCNGLKALCQKLGIRQVSAHDLRHLSASLLLRQGVPLPAVAARLGHGTPHTTAKVYSHALGDDGRAAEAIGRAVRCDR